MKYRPTLLAARAAVVLLALGCLIPRASADVVFASPNSPASTVLTAWYQQDLPECFYGLEQVKIYLYNDKEMDRYLTSVGLEDGASYANSSAGEIDGLFDNRRMQISLRVNDRGLFDRETLTHEYGHYVWFHVFTDADRAQYRQIYDTQRRAGSLVTDYASVNLEEGFAEAFAYFIVDPASLKLKDDASYSFIASWASVRTSQELASLQGCAPATISFPFEASRTIAPVAAHPTTFSAVEIVLGSDL